MVLQFCSSSYKSCNNLVTVFLLMHLQHAQMPEKICASFSITFFSKKLKSHLLQVGRLKSTQVIVKD